MKVSIITAVRNGAEDIGITLDSVAAQDFPDLEHVIIDGASTDDTLQRVRERSSRLGAVVSERDRGVYDAFNKGIAAATGEWLGFLGAGDRFAGKDAVSSLIAAANARSADSVFADLEIVGDDGRALRRYRSSSFTRERVAGGYMPAHPTLLIRRSVYERFGNFDIGYRIAGDFEFVVRAYAVGGTSFAYVPRVLVHMKDGGLSNRGWRSKWRITREMRRACAAHGVSSSWARLLLRLPLKYLSESFLTKGRAGPG